MSRFKPDTRDVVLGWTLFTTTFVWTPTMRMFLKPEISNWSVFGLSGSGLEGAFWIFPLAVALALFLFYLEGRGRLRPLFHLLLLGWHLPLTGALVYWGIRMGDEATFVGGAWGWEVSFAILALPFLLFSALAVRWIRAEMRGDRKVEVVGWTELEWRSLAVALALFPVALFFFSRGEGYDGWVRIAIATNVLQWILLAQGLGAPARAVGAERESRVKEGLGRATG